MNLILKILIIIIIIIILIKPIKNFATIKKLNNIGKINYNEIKLFSNKFDGFYVNKEKYLLNKKINNEDLIYYNNGKIEKSVLNIGDILLHGIERMVGKFIGYITNSNITHVSIIHSIEINNNKIDNQPKILSDNYLPVNFFIIQSTEVAEYSNNKKLKGIFKISLIDHLNTSKKKIHIVRYKYFTDDKVKKVKELCKFFYNSKYNYYSYLYHPIQQIKKNICTFGQKLLNNDEDNCIDWYSYSDPNSNNIPFKLLLKYKNKLNDLYNNFKSSKNKEKYYKKITTYNKIINEKISNRYFNCSEFIYFIYYYIGIDLFPYKRLNIDPEIFSKNILPTNYLELLQNDNFEYVSTLFQ